MANPWFRLWTDMVNDPKWRTIARKSNQRIGDVISVYMHMMTAASNATERGRTQGWSDEDVATALDLETSDVGAIRDAMQSRVLDGDYLTGWEKRQPKREDDSASRSKKHRETQKEIALQTQPNATDHKNTLDKIREDKEEIKTLPCKPDVISILEYLNDKASRNYHPLPANLKLIESRMKEGATLDQCKAVIDSKVLEWINDPKMKKYIRPETLFNATKFAQYIGQIGDIKTKPSYKTGDKNEKGQTYYDGFGWAS